MRGMQCVAVLGFLLPGGDIFGLMTVNMADNVLHIVLAIVFLWVGFGSMGTAPITGTRSPPFPPLTVP